MVLIYVQCIHSSNKSPPSPILKRRTLQFNSVHRIYPQSPVGGDMTAHSLKGSHRLYNPYFLNVHQKPLSQGGCEDKEVQLTALPHTRALARSLLEAGAGRSRFCWDEERRRSRAGTATAPLETTAAPRSDPAPRGRLALTTKKQTRV